MPKVSQAAIKKLFNKARRIVKHPGFDLLVAPSESIISNHLIVVTPAHIGNAVERNRIRRRIKAFFHEEKLNQKPLDYVIFVKKEGINLSLSQLKEIILGALHAASL